MRTPTPKKNMIFFFAILTMGIVCRAHVVYRPYNDNGAVKVFFILRNRSESECFKGRMLLSAMADRSLFPGALPLMLRSGYLRRQRNTIKLFQRFDTNLPKALRVRSTRYTLCSLHARIRFQMNVNTLTVSCGALLINVVDGILLRERKCYISLPT